MSMTTTTTRDRVRGPLWPHGMGPISGMPLKKYQFCQTCQAEDATCVYATTRRRASGVDVVDASAAVAPAESPSNTAEALR